MTKSRKRELLALLVTMQKMADLLPKLENPAEQIQDILAACECLRENLEGENAPKCLDLLQTIAVAVETDNYPNDKNDHKDNLHQESVIPIYPSLRMHIKTLESAFKSEVKTKKEILFLPYKASMWDSLESIYLAAKDDPNCEALVMPIPYYDKKDGKHTDMHWEISYPKGIPLIDYNKYSIEECRPDIIFIHNPYDDYNIVTSVHSDYFSKKLRDLTKCLVYVPYFVGNGINMPKHFCTLPGCIFAHKVIVQTEQEREIYAKEYKKVARDANKFLALGSPKLDKAVSAKREDYEIPMEWTELINNTVGATPRGCPAMNDGDPATNAGDSATNSAQRKKIIFYNTSIGTLLENTVENNKPSDKYLQKVKNVFEFFKHREDAVLLWRPHPLLEGTITSMRPWIGLEYAKIVSEYKNGDYGIYDDSADLNRAVAMSDMYYGDGSSVARLFEAAGKPVVYQAFGAPVVSGLYDDGDYFWFMDCYNALYRYDRQSKETEFMGVVPAQNHWACLGIAENNRKLYLAPFYKSNKISVFDTIQKSFEQIEFKDDYKHDRNLINAISFKNFVYFIPHDFPAIMRFNTDTEEVEYFSEWIDEVSKLQVSKLQNETWKHVKFFGFCVAGAEIALVMHRANAVMFFDMETGGYEIRNIGEKSEQYNDICFDGQNYYLASIYKKHVVKWNRQSNEVSKIEIPSFSRMESIGGSFFARYLNEYVWLFPYAANNAYKININTNEITELPELTEHFEVQNISFYYNTVYTNENTIYASTLNKGIAEYNINTHELNFIEPPPNSEIHALLNCKSEPKIEAEAVNSGKMIWKYLKGNCL